MNVYLPITCSCGEEYDAHFQVRVDEIEAIDLECPTCSREPIGQALSNLEYDAYQQYADAAADLGIRGEPEWFTDR
jgi:hypothetical protein